MAILVCLLLGISGPFSHCLNGKLSKIGYALTWTAPFSPLLLYLPLLEICLVYLVHFVIAWISVWHSVECCEHRMYHLHKVKLCIGRTEIFALFLRFWFWFNEIDDFQIFEVKWERVAQFESFLLWNGTTVCSLHFVLRGHSNSTFAHICQFLDPPPPCSLLI